ncbi:hypothetical protein, partial [Brunnivagina elsteri]
TSPMYARLMRLPLEVTPCLPAGYADGSVPHPNEMCCKPKCEAGKETFQRGCWILTKVGQIGLQTACKLSK